MTLKNQAVPLILESKDFQASVRANGGIPTNISGGVEIPTNIFDKKKEKKYPQIIC